MKELLLRISGLKGSATKTNEWINKQIRLIKQINRKIEKTDKLVDYENILEKKNLTELSKTNEKRRCNTQKEITQ